MKFLVLGCNGMAGHIVSLYLKERGHDVTGFGRQKSKFVDSIIGDALDTQLVSRLIKNEKFDSIINCIGILNHFAESNHALASFLNSYFPHFLADETKDMGTQIIHMSTDCVFSGVRGNYEEGDVIDSTTYYGRSKALGELNDKKNITFRNSIVGPDYDPDGPSLLNWFMTRHEPINGFTNKMWNGITTLELAKAIENAVIQKAHGLFHMVPAEPISKFSLLSLFNHYLCNDKVIINPIEGEPSDFSLKRTNYTFSYTVPTYDIMVREMADWIKSHHEVYPHYIIK